MSNPPAESTRRLGCEQRCTSMTKGGGESLASWLGSGIKWYKQQVFPRVARPSPELHTLSLRQVSCLKLLLHDILLSHFRTEILGQSPCSLENFGVQGRVGQGRVGQGSKAREGNSLEQLVSSEELRLIRYVFDLSNVKNKKLVLTSRKRRRKKCKCRPT